MSERFTCRFEKTTPWDGRTRTLLIVHDTERRRYGVADVTRLVGESEHFIDHRIEQARDAVIRGLKLPPLRATVERVSGRDIFVDTTEHLELGPAYLDLRGHIQIISIDRARSCVWVRGDNIAAITTGDRFVETP